MKLYLVTRECCGHDDIHSVWSTPELAGTELKRLNDEGLTGYEVIETTLDERNSLVYGTLEESK